MFIEHNSKYILVKMQYANYVTLTVLCFSWGHPKTSRLSSQDYPYNSKFFSNSNFNRLWFLNY